MGIETQAVLSGHHGMADLCRRLQTIYGADRIHPRTTHKPDYQMIEFIDYDGEVRVVHVFLNSYAADDYRELGATESTFITMKLGPTSQAVVSAIAQGSAGWLRWQDTGPWIKIS